MIRLIICILWILNEETNGGKEDKQILNPLGCKDSSFDGGKTVNLDDDAVHLIRCQSIGKSNYLINFNIRSKATQYHLYFTTGPKCETGDMDYDDDTVPNWDKDPVKAREKFEFYAERDDSHIFEGSSSQRSVAITNYILTPKEENEWFCFMIKDDMFSRHSTPSVTIQYLFEPETTIWSNNIIYTKPVEKVKIEGIGLNKDEILNRPISKCCRIIKTKDSKNGTNSECEFIDIDESGSEATAKFKYPITDEGFIQISMGTHDGETHCPENWTTVGQIGGFNILNLLNHKTYGPCIIGGALLLILLICACFQQWQKQRMIAMVMQPRQMQQNQMQQNQFQQNQFQQRK